MEFSQVNYIDKILAKFSMQNTRKGFTPFRNGLHLSKYICPRTQEMRDKMSNCPYALAIGSLMYVMLYIRSDINHTVSVVSTY